MKLFNDYDLNATRTENGAAALKSTGNKCLDLFGFGGGAKTDADIQRAVSMFASAYNESTETAMRMLFYFRDARGGQGRRALFRAMLVWLANAHPNQVRANLANIMEYGRGDDYLCLLDTIVAKDVVAWLYHKLGEDFGHMLKGEPCSLLAKWMPSENASSKQNRKYARYLATQFGWSARQYRTCLTALRAYLRIVETYMSRGKWGEIDYAKVPGYATLKYTNAFSRHDMARHNKYLEDLAVGKFTAKANTLYPHDITTKVGKMTDVVVDAMWKALPNYFEGRNESILCMVDTSGSMSGEPYNVAVALGLYCASKNKGPFGGMFLTFAEKPSIVAVDQSLPLSRQLRSINCINAGNTDIEAAFNLILQHALKNRCKQEDLPTKLVILSDMQFDEARGASGYYWNRYNRPNQTFMDDMKQKFERHGYTMPSLVYWNLRDSNCGMYQARFDGENCCMVSGYSASLFDAVIKGTTYVERVKADGTRVLEQKLDPMEVMRNTLFSARYDAVVVC